MSGDFAEEDELMNQLIEESPYLNRAYKRGLTEGKAKRKAKERLLLRKEFTMTAIATRFSPPLTVYRDLEKKIKPLDDENLLKDLFDQAITAENIETFQKWLLEHLPNN